jgi:hypothetical protein
MSTLNIDDLLHMEHSWIDADKAKPKYPQKNLSHCHYFHHKSYMAWSGIKTCLRD